MERNRCLRVLAAWLVWGPALLRKVPGLGLLFTSLEACEARGLSMGGGHHLPLLVMEAGGVPGGPLAGTPGGKLMPRA